MPPEKRAIQSLHGTFREPPAQWSRPSDGNSHTPFNPLLRLHGLEDAVDRILEAPRQEILELTVAEYGVQFGCQAEMGVPGPARNALPLPSHLSKATTRILRGERFEDKSP